ncbi:MAG TPA: NTF2-like N-terminal transpeptidase domain-containing protein, partial [Tepidiformaceae bacterium]|nr:NTF2-like N-terminal transpeptidase domain-containing protein [Tepidiformaceae bacterium]
MRGVFLAAVVVGLITGGLVAGLRSCTDDGSPETSKPADPSTPNGAAEAFAAAWTRSDIAALYLLLTPQAQASYPVSAFQEAYANFEREATLDRLEASVAKVEGSTATVAVRAFTAYFADLEYTIAINLVQTGSEWRVAWEPGAIYPDLVNGNQLKSEIQRPTRGRILARDGTELAVTRDMRMAGLNRSLVQDRTALAAALAPFGMGQAEVDAAFAAPGGLTQRVALGPIPDEMAEAAVTQLMPVPGIVLYFQESRVHPLGPSAAHVVGYTRELTAEELTKRKGQGYRIGDRAGAIGIEASQDEVLSGKIGAELRVVDRAGSTVKTLVSREFAQGQDVQTT